jgi:hypothetical protein
MTERRNRLMQGLMAVVPKPGNFRDWRQMLDMGTNFLGIPGDWYNSQTQQWNNPLEAFGLNQLFGGGHQPTAPLPTGLNPNVPGAATQPGPNTWSQGQVPGQQPQGNGPLMSYQTPRPRNIRPGGGQVLAEGAAAQRMVEGMRGNSVRSIADQAAEAHDRMYAGKPK